MASTTSGVITVILAVLVISLVLGAPPPPLPGIGPGAPLAGALKPDADTTLFVEYMQSCDKPGSQLCSAYEEINKFYGQLVGEKVSQTILADAFAAFHAANISELCRALTVAGPVVKAIAVNGTKARYYGTITEPEICSRRCSEINDDDKVVVRPVCKVLAYELGVISKRTNEVKESASGNTSIQGAKSEDPLKVIPIAGGNSAAAPVVVVVTGSNIAPPQQIPAVVAPQLPVVADPGSSSSAPTEDKKPVSITPGTNPQLAEDVKPPAPVVSQAPSKVSSTSTVDYSSVLVSNNNEPDDNMKLPLDTKQSQQPDEIKVGGSLDDDQGAEDPFNGPNGDDDADDGDYGLEEKLPAPETNVSEKQKNKPSENVSIASKVETEEKPPRNKKPTQVGDSFEVEEQRRSGGDFSRNRAPELIEDPFYEETDSNFFAYFLLVMAACVLGYVAYHNKKKVLALLLEGRRGSTGRGGGSTGSRRSRGGGSRKHTAAYQKLDSNLEEAITSTGQSRSSQIIY